ncbi:MAG: hypothetical protein M1831_005242 [Alyxoria varia]|nr:MAG: hypothetical protein M1831_005242 [Alyxoria varia]
MNHPHSKLDDNQENNGQRPLASPRTAAVTSGFEDLGIDADGRGTETASLYTRLESNDGIDRLFQPDEHATSCTEVNAKSGPRGEAQKIPDNGEANIERTIRLQACVEIKGEAHGLPSGQDNLEPQAEKFYYPVEPNNDQPSSCVPASTASAQDNANESSKELPEPAIHSELTNDGGRMPSSPSTLKMANMDHAFPEPSNKKGPGTLSAASDRVVETGDEETADAKPNQNINQYTWQDFEITGHLMLDPQDDGYGMNGIGFQPSRQEAAARLRKRRQQIADWRANEAREARDKRSLKRRKMTDWNADAEEADEMDPREKKSRRTVRFAIDTA